MQPILFYDGDCGLCHRAVRLLLRLDRRGRLHYAPLGGASFRERVAEPERWCLPDSLVLCTADGGLLVRAAAVRESLRLAQGVGRLLAALLGLVPGWLADRLYDALARRRRRLFARPAASCPVLPARWRGRFLP